MKLSICIPTYNRAHYLVNCLNSIVIAKLYSNLKFQVCISDNGSTDNTEQVVKEAKLLIDIKYHKYKKILNLECDKGKQYKLLKRKMMNTNHLNKIENMMISFDKGSSELMCSFTKT